MKIDVNCLVGNAHCPPAQLEWATILAEGYFIVLKALRGVDRCWLNRLLSSLA